VETLTPAPPEGGGVDAAVTVTVADCDAEPPEPLQLSEYVDVVFIAPVLSVPNVDFVPDHAPDAVQEVALVELQESVAVLPDGTEAGLAAKVTVGAAVDETETVVD
jgi:hypothetical protein